MKYHPEDENSAGKPVSKRRSLYRWILMAAAVAAVGWVAAGNIGRLGGTEAGYRYGYILYALLAAACAYLTMFAIWTRLALVFGLRAPAVRAGRAYFLSYLARYIPGKVGLFLMRAEVYGGRSSAVVMATALEQIVVLAAAFLLVLIGVLVTPSLFPLWIRIASLAGLAVIVMLMRPAFLSSVSRLLGRITGREIPEARTTFGTNLRFMLLYTAPSILHGLSLFLVIRAIHPVPLVYLPGVTGAYVGAIVIGLFALIVPGGLGVREGAMILALSALVPESVAIIAPVMTRLITIAAELGLAAWFGIASLAGRSEAQEVRSGLIFIVHEYPPIVGGTGVFVRNIVEAAGAETDILVITAAESGRTRLEKEDRAAVLRLGVPFRDRKFHYATVPSMAAFALLAAWHGWRLGRKGDYSAVQGFHLIPSGAVAVLLSRLLGVPCLVTAIGAEVHDPASKRKIHTSPVYRRILAWVIKNADRVSAISTDIARRAREYHDRSDMEILPPGIKSPPLISTGRPSETLTLCSVSRLARRKGIADLVRALALLKDLPIRYVAVGDGSERGELESLSEELGIAERVEFTGSLGEMEKYEVMSRSDIFVLPSHHEGFGICYIEAMSAGLPVIASDSGGQLDFIADGVSGLLVKAGEPESIAAAVRRLCEDAELREAMGRRNIEKAKEYQLPRLRKRYLAYYGIMPDPHERA